MEAEKNPAAILISYIEDALTLSRDTQMIRVWASIFGCGTDEPEKISEGLINLHRLVDDCEALIIAHAPGSPDRYLVPIKKIKHVLSKHDLLKNWSSYMGVFSEGVMTALGFCDQILEIEFAKKYPGTPEEVYDLIDELHELLNKCLDSTLNPELKRLFAKNLDALRQALIDYRIGGEQQVQDVIEKFTGSVVMNKGQIEESFDEASDLLESSANILEKVGTVINKGKELTALASPVAKYLIGLF
ncbi:hypothetical protein [Pseudomonas viridiflava]|uniref:hypothetical protein n=1 Tax=Pseudomonas viridiflava TaxID=33069 RepID=UPI000F01CB1D|nr:hypothetical protein [Pseudomonas viridiflava]